MTVKERINPKTGLKQYKARYYFYAEGKRRDSETAWCASREAAEEEANKLKEAKEKADRHKVLTRRDKTFKVAFKEYMDEGKEKIKDAKTNTPRNDNKVNQAIYRKHIPVEIAETKVKDIDSITFKKWVMYINSTDLAGITIRHYMKAVKRFNRWLCDNGYYLDEELDVRIELAIKRVKLKDKREGNKEDAGLRHVVTAVELMKIGRYYIDNDLGKFKNFYYYTFFYVLFFSGMRVEEITALQWKFIDLRADKRTISIKNAISKIEGREAANARLARGEYRTKNKGSVRKIPIFDFYYQLLIDYRESYKYEFNLTDAEVEEGFVFPKLSKPHSPYEFLQTDTIWRQVKKVTEAVGIPNTDNQMFRHSCATFLILPPPDGLGFSENKVKDYFGHEDTTMLESIYARLNMMQKAERMRDTFSDIFSPDVDKEKEESKAALQKMVDRMNGGNEWQKAYARKKRIWAQIKQVSNNKVKKCYYFNAKDKDIIEEYKKNNPECKLEFVQE